MNKEEQDENATLPTYTNHNGFLMPKGFPVEGFTSGLQYQAQKNDLIVSTYPKCGTTWTQHLVYLILHDGKTLSPNERLDKMFPHLEEVGKDFVSSSATVSPGNDSFRLIKTHLPYHMTPQHAKAKFIYVARNPKDVVVSFFHHTRGFIKAYNFGEGSFDAYFDLFLHGKVDFGDYFDNLRSWFDHREDTNVLFLTYEKMRADTRAAVLEIAAFLDEDVYPAKLIANDDEIMKQVLAHSSLSSMKKDPLRWCSERPKEHTAFIRQGSVGEWDELLKPEQAALLDDKMKANFSLEELAFFGDKYF